MANWKDKMDSTRSRGRVSRLYQRLDMNVSVPVGFPPPDSIIGVVRYTLFFVTQRE